MTRPEDVGAPSNWGRWGAQDERGTLNLLTPELARAAAGLVRTGAVYSLAAPLSPDGPSLPTRRQTWHVVTQRYRPERGATFVDDVVMMHTHGTTHIDALCHCFVGDALYNGHPADAIQPDGARRCGIDQAGPLVRRGPGHAPAARRHRPRPHRLVAALRPGPRGPTALLRERARSRRRLRPLVPRARPRRPRGR